MLQNTIKKEIEPNERQKLCIENFEGKFMVLAGPGTGKTFTVIRRIQNMIKKGVDPSKILCLTFSTPAASEMKERLIKISGDIASRIKIFTYHAFCNDIISKNPMEFGLSDNYQIIKETQKLKLIKEVIDELELEFFVPANAHKYHYAQDFIKIAEKINSLRLSEEKYLSHLETNPEYYPKMHSLEQEIYEREQKGETRNIGRYNTLETIKKNIEKAKEVWKIAELYQTKKQKENLIDFNDMINIVLNTFEENPIKAKEIANEFSYLLVDEYQDTNKAQNEIIFNLLDNMENQNILIVGDDDQIIFGFQGADDNNIENFKLKYPDTKIICLNENNRSTQEILDLSYILMQQNKTRIENNPIFKNDNISKKLTAKNEEIKAKTKKIRRWHFNNSMQEINEIINDIENVVKSPLCPVKDGEKRLDEIAVLSRNRNQINTISSMLKARNIPFQITDGKDIFLIRSVILTYFYMKALTNNILNSDKLFGILLDGPFEIEIEDYNKLLSENSIRKKENRKDFITLMKEMKGFLRQDKIDNFLTTYDNLKTYSKTHNLRDTVVEIINRTDILTFFFAAQENKYENIEGIKTLINEADSLMESNKTASLKDFVEYLDECFENNIIITTEKDTNIQNAIQLLTYHASKGREFEYVYMPDLTAKIWEDSRGGNNTQKLITDEIKTEEKKDAENLKLLFVGITRAKYALTLSFADFEEEKAQNITKYLSNIQNFDFEKTDFEYNDDNFLSQYIKKISTKAYNNRLALKNIIKSKVENLEMSPSRLNDFINCPRSFYYSCILGIDTEEKNWDWANFGTCIHSTIEQAERTRLNKGYYPKLQDMVDNFLNKLEMCKISTDAMREKFEKEGTKILEDYYPQFSDIENDKLYDVEFEFNGIRLNDYKLTGKIDRIEKNQNGTYSLIDYKTGQVSSEKQIDINGKKSDYYRQLCFYKYAFEKLTNNIVEDVSILYLKDVKKSVRKKLTESDVEYIKKEITNCYKKMENFEFDPPQDVSKEKCEKCAYKKLCTLDLL